MKKEAKYVLVLLHSERDTGTSPRCFRRKRTSGALEHGKFGRARTLCSTAAEATCVCIYAQLKSRVHEYTRGGSFGFVFVGRLTHMQR
jgi:hypothetical protein